MRAVAQRVLSAKVTVYNDAAGADETTGAIEKGLLVYLGADKNDTDADARAMAEKLAVLRIFADENDKMSLSVTDIGGAVLVVSQFTLFGDVRTGRRPSFDAAAPPELALKLYEDTCAHLRSLGLCTETGRFRAMMQVHSVGDGPITILLDTKKVF
ncbi:MAG: D-tyrosyl-tRNA(Tyr) deacylase [Sandaracinaceae bacterium]|jgi:D-tyrosyl-tRNA(Tyr) deacylase|nr:D-tyrosyl-tRNA(Tyr) deacylase [Sandaracinaceae bacterium]